MSLDKVQAITRLRSLSNEALIMLSKIIVDEGESLSHTPGQGRLAQSKDDSGVRDVLISGLIF